MPNTPNSKGTIAGILAVAAILVAGVWVLNRLDASQKAQLCAERRGTNCATIDVDALPRR